MRKIFLLSFWLFLLCWCVGISGVVPLKAQSNATDIVGGKYYWIKSANQRVEAQQMGCLYDDNGTLRAQAQNVTEGSDEQALQLWLVTEVSGKTGYYTIQNKKTGKFLQGATDTSTDVTTTTTATEVYVPKNTKTGSSLTWFNILPTEGAQYSLNWRYNDNKTHIAGYACNDGKSSGFSGSEWAFIQFKTQEEITAERDAVQTAAGQVKPVAGDKVYRIFNYSDKFNTQAVCELNNKLGSVADGTDNNAQYWQLIDQGNGKVALQNYLTGHYVQSLKGVKDTQYLMGINPAAFTIQANEHVSQTYAYDIRDVAQADGTLLGLNCTDKPNGAIYSWTLYDGSKDANSLWVFKEANLTDEQLATIKAERANYDKQNQLLSLLSYGKIRIKSRRATHETWNEGGSIKYVDCTGRLATDMTGAVTDKNGTCRMEQAKTGDDAYRQVWLVESNGAGFQFKNVYTQKYLNYTNTGDAKVFYVRWNPDNAAGENYINLCENANFKDKGLHYQTTYHVLVGWDVNANDYRGCDWVFEKVEDITDDNIKAFCDKKAGRLNSITTTDYIVIRNTDGSVLTENLTSGAEESVERNTDKMNQVWKLETVDGKEGYYQIKNVLTNHYVGFANYDKQIYNQTTASEGGYKINALSSYNKYGSYWELRPTSLPNRCLHRSGTRAIIWSTFDDVAATGSVWSFELANITEDQLAEAKAQYDLNKNEIASLSTYAAALSELFSDAACTTLQPTYQAMSDDDLKAAMIEKGLTSAVLQQMTLKVKNNSWADWEKIFRVRNVEPYTNPDTWNDILKIGYVYTRLSNPTGIWGKTNNVVYVFVGADIPEGASIHLRQVSKTDEQGTSTQLSKGLNIVNVDNDAALYVNYEVTTSDVADSKKWRDYPDIPIHIEGGEVDGYFDATREGINTNEAWKQMVAKGMFSKPFAMMKGRNVIYQMNSTLTKETIPEKMREIVDFWDWMVDVQHSLMAVNEYKDRWHSVLGFYSCTYNFMFASSFGTYYNESTLGEILSYDKMSAGGGSLWGPAHEVGHIHQGLINMIGCTEISNNLFSQAVVHLNGKTSTRLNGRKFKNVADLYAAGKSWHDYDLWDRNTLYLKLYLYYEVAGHHPGLFCELFRQLRKDPMNHSKGSKSNPVPASQDFLKFATKVSDIVKEDLSEFFQAYGFFVPFNTRCIGDYGDYYTNCTQEMIDEAKAHMQQYAKPKGNLLFIENHIKHEPAQDHAGNYLHDAAGNIILRSDFSDTDAVGKCGDVGSYSDYTDGHYASGYTYTRSGNTITMNGNGAVGYKVYDAAGNLLYFSNCNSFVLPQSVADKLSGQTMVIKVAQPDGTDITLPTAGATTYALKVYHADALTADKSNTVYTDGTAQTLPVLVGNAIAVIQPNDVQSSNLPSALVQATNVVNGNDNTAYHVVITDKLDFYTPTNFTAQSLSYHRSGTAGYNSVCLPFAVNASDFGAGARLEQYASMNSNTISFTSATDDNAAGQPCLVYCPDEVTEWNIEKENAYITASTFDTNDGNATLIGSFINTPIGAGCYKLTADGAAFGITTAKGKVTAFRCYLKPSGAAAAQRLQVLHDGGAITAVMPQTNAIAQPVEVYDLSGRRVQHPLKSGLYIVNGQKVMVK